MGKKITILAIAFAVVAFTEPTYAQQSEKVYRVGYLGGSKINRAFRQGLRELGYIEGQNLILEHRRSRGKKQYFRFAKELVRLRVDVLFANSTRRALAAKNATKSIPIVFLSAVDPVAAGLVDSLARPGRNLTGVTHIAPELAGKRLQLLKETIPKLSRVAVLWQPGNLGSEQLWKESQLAAPGLGLQLHSMEVTSADQFEGAFQRARKAGSTALAVTLSGLINRNRKRIAELAIENRLPAMFSDSRPVRYGGLMSYAPDRNEQYRRAATYVDKILKGAKPADLPVQRPPKFDLVVNLKTAKALGITIPPSILLRATEVIE